MAFEFASSQPRVLAAGATSVEVTLPIPSGRAGQVQILIVRARRRSSDNDPLGFYDPPGWNPIGVPCEFGSGIRAYMMAWWRQLDGSETEVTVERTNSNTLQGAMQIMAAYYASPSFKLAELIGVPVDDTTDPDNVSSYTFPPYHNPQQATVISIYGTNATASGTVIWPGSGGDAQGFEYQAHWWNEPVSLLMIDSYNRPAGVWLGPTNAPIGSGRFSKTFALPGTPPRRRAFRSSGTATVRGSRG